VEYFPFSPLKKCRKALFVLTVQIIDENPPTISRVMPELYDYICQAIVNKQKILHQGRKKQGQV
jgi:hypothetical protein